MNEAEYLTTLRVLFEYGLYPISVDGDLIIISTPNGEKRVVLAGERGDEVPVRALRALLEHIAMDEDTFWQLYPTI